MSRRRPQDPKTPRQWQLAVDIAEGALQLDSARQYGLVSGGPVVDLDRCEEILKRGRAKGFRPRPDAGPWLALTWNHAHRGPQHRGGAQLRGKPDLGGAVEEMTFDEAREMLLTLGKERVAAPFATRPSCRAGSRKTRA